NGSAAIARLADDLAAERLEHLGDVFAGEDRVVHDQVAHRLVVFASNYRSKLLHIHSPYCLLISPGSVRSRGLLSNSNVYSRPRAAPRWRRAIPDQYVRQRVQRYDSHHVPAVDSRFGHAVHHAGMLILRKR